MERKTYHDVLKIPGTVDRWLTANARSPQVSFLKDYLMMDVGADHVVCYVERVQDEITVS
jgi:hypothetical protein